MTDVPFSFPKHRISYRHGKYKVVVFFKGLIKLKPEQRIKLLLELAKKKPLIGMAYIHKCAAKGDLYAEKEAHAYANYQRSLEKKIPVTQVPAIEGKYNAFPDLIKHQGFYYLAYREANKHQGDKGKIRILKGKKINSWEVVAILESSTYDLRDPKFFIRDNQLHLMIGGSVIKKMKTKKMVPHVAHLIGDEWLLEKAIVPPINQWIWQVTWHKEAGYGFAYGPDKYQTLHLMKTADGRTFKKIATLKCEGLHLTESTIRFKKDGSAIALLRADPKTCIATAKPPYKKWTITPLPIYGGGQNFVLTKGSSGIATTRHLFLNPDNTIEERQLIARIDEKQITPLMTLPSEIDTGYAGIVLEEDGCLTIAYYSAASDRTSSIYITKLKGLSRR